MATEYTDGLNAIAAMNNAAIAQGLVNEDNRLVGTEAVQAEILANLLNGELSIASELPAAGAGITAGVGTIVATSVTREGGLIRTDILIDLTGLASAAAGDVIGAAAGGAAYIATYDEAVSGVNKGGTLRCFEAPAGGDADIDVYSATVATGAYNDAVSGLAGQTQVVNSGTLALTTDASVIPDTIADGDYLYLVSVGATAAAYTAGRALLTLWGVPA